MAQHEDFTEANLTMVPPAGLEDVVAPLRVRRLEGQIVSCWRFTAAELEEIARTGGLVWLSIMGHGMPPVLVTAHRADVI